MIKAKLIKVELPKKWFASDKVLKEVDKNLIRKKLKKYGFFDENGKWKEK